MSFSYLSVVICAIAGNFFYDYYIISDKVYFLLSLSVLFFWMPSLLLKLKKRKMIAAKEKIVFTEYSFFFFLLVLSAANIIAEGKFSIGSEEFEENYSRGITAHLRNLITVLFTYFLCFKKETIISIIIKIASFVLIFISGTKYHIIFPFLIWFVLFLHRNKSLKKMLFLSFNASLAIFILFFSNYYIGFHLRGTFENSHNFFNFIVNHFLTYVSGGLISFSQILENNYINLGVFYNTENTPYDAFVSLSSTSDSIVSNVRTIFGCYLLSYGYLFTYTLFLILGFVFHYMYMLLSESGNKYYFIAYGFFIASPMILSFFASYYRLLNIWEYTFFSLMLCLVFKKYNYKKSNRIIFNN
jgi:oligosaccharide repeat unit polymerase